VQFAGEVGHKQRPRIWANSPTIYMKPVDEAPPFPPFLNDQRSRTEVTIRALDRILTGSDATCLDTYCVRICAKRSSFAISDLELGYAEDPQFHRLLLEERDKLVQLFRRGASLKAILTWNIHEWLGMPSSARERARLRLAQLRNFFQEVLADEGLVSRATVVRSPVSERNLLFLGTDYFFEGRMLRWEMGFDATELITDPDTINQEIVWFDTLFENGLRHVCRTSGFADAPNRNRHLLDLAVKDLDQDISRLTASPS
jgi:hypothetical protein